MDFLEPPDSAAWRHVGGREGFEVAFFHPLYGGYRIEGGTVGTEDGRHWAVDYAIRIDATWTTRVAEIRERSETGSRAVVLEQDTPGHWTVDGVAAPQLDGCLDVDLECSALTNALPVHRLHLAAGRRVPVSAAYVRTFGQGIWRLDQTYTSVGGDGAHRVVDYTAPAFDFTARLTYDARGLVLNYPTIAVRAG